MNDNPNTHQQTNKKTIEKLTNSNVLLTGIVFVITGVALIFSSNDIVSAISIIAISIGSSLIASAYIARLYSHYIDQHKSSDIDKWGLVKIFKTRSEMLIQNDEYIKNTKKTLDFILFASLKMLRDSENDKIIKEKIKKGLKINILAVDPDSIFLELRHKTKKLTEGSSRDDHISLHEWILSLKKVAPNPENIKIKTYDYMLLEWYMKTDDYIFVGPHRYDLPSVNTITMGYTNNSEGYKYYNEYFNKLWNDPAFAKEPDNDKLIKWGIANPC
ncbi:MAG: hypothetical protein FWE90_09180 [Defluviitaleaceae bacterium]|nr:hypothetical protein [Defluviitaleaceae bacterium]